MAQARALLSLAVLALMAATVIADLRLASTPKTDFKVKSNKRAVKFVTEEAIYMEPSTFGFAGLEKQKTKNYDQFLRSNVDNEHDKRNFANEPGKDHLPFRTLEGASTDATNQLGTRVFTAAPGSEHVVPLRWNNPHSSELEVNIWIRNNTVVVPIRKPACAGEGHQDAAFSFKIPTDFNNIQVPDFKGCNVVGDCVMQIYAHSVETRIYAIGVPIVIPGFPQGTQAQGWNGVENARKDVGTDLSKLRELCLSSADNSTHIANAKPRRARLVSDQYNHAYQNSDSSPYHGQQPEAISQNLQAAAIVDMTVANRGELGKSILKHDQRKLLNKARKKALKLVKKYELIASSAMRFINLWEEHRSEDNIAGTQKTAKCFRCAEVGATNAKRQETNTYIPSYKIPGPLVAKVKNMIPAKYQKVVSNQGTMQIYQAVLQDMQADLDQLAQLDLHYQPAMVKDTLGTMKDATNFTKRDANNKKDKGQYAARMAYEARQNQTAQEAEELEFDYADDEEEPIDEEEVEEQVQPEVVQEEEPEEDEDEDEEPEEDEEESEEESEVEEDEEPKAEEQSEVDEDEDEDEDEDDEDEDDEANEEEDFELGDSFFDSVDQEDENEDEEDEDFDLEY